MIETSYGQVFDELEMMQDDTPNHGETYGDHLEEEPSHDTTRLYIQNLNGLRWDEDGGRWPFVCEVISSLQVDIACFSELNTNTNKYKVRHQMEQICQRQFNQSRLVTATTPFDTKRTYKPGGTAILACNEIVTQIKSHSRDRMGRWTSLLITSISQNVRIISAYQVCNTTTKGTTTASSQQQAQLILEQSQTQNHNRRTPRQAFIQELQSFIRQCQQLQELIILAGDFNEDLNDSNSGMMGLIEACGLVDLFAIRIGTSAAPATYQRGTKRIDYVLVSPTLLPHVQSAGYEPFGYRIPSDHRGIYIDFSTQALFQQQVLPMAPIQKREFSSKSPGIVNEYVSAKMKYLQEHRFFSRLDRLMAQEVHNRELAEALDRDFQRAAQHAAKKCTRKTRPPWSPKLAKIWATLHFYRLSRSAQTTTANYEPAIRKLQAKWPHLPIIIPTALCEIAASYKASVQALKEAQANARALRDAYLQQKAEAYVTTDNSSKAKVLKRLLRAETQRQVYEKLRYIRNKNTTSAGLSQLKIPIGVSYTDTDSMRKLPDTSEHWETITIPQRIEQLLLSRNRQHFGQAKDTPFAKPPLRTEVGYKADGLVVEMILSGNYQQSATPEAARLLIQHLQQRTSSVIEATITSKQIVDKLKVWNEATTTSPSGLHLGHYHCLWRQPTPTGDDENDARLKQDQKILLQATADMMNYAIRHGYSYERWTKVVNVMLQKDAGNPRIHRLRVIHIYEADYNLLLAVKWRQALHHAEDHKLLNEGLYGSRPGRTAHDPVLLEVLQNEIYRMTMKSGINFDLDATSCYDRILVNVASICSRRVGTPKAVALVNAATLEQARYHLKTNLGVSSSSYTHCSQYPIFGTGQGSGNSPTVWCFVCSALFDAIETVTTGAQFASYNRQYQVHIFMVGFVDDCTQRVNSFHADTQPNATQLTRMMEKDAQIWNDVLWASGGALEQSKCSYHLIQSSWTKDGQPFLQGGTQTTNIQLRDGPTMNRVCQKSCYDSHKTLGCYINPAHKNQSTWISTKTKNEQFARALESNYLSTHETWVYYTSFYIPSITYAIPMSPLTYQQCTDLNSRFLRGLLPRLGYNRNISTVLRYTPQSMGGVGLKHLYHVQGLLLLQHAFKYLNSPTTVIGKMFRIALSWTQTFLGISESILTNVHQRLPPVGPSILLDLRQFLHHMDAHLRHPIPFHYQAVRVHDRFIMDVALGQQGWNDKQVLQINSCRRYLQALTLADICTPMGTRLTYAANISHEPPSSSVLRMNRFNQQKPSRPAWTTWRKFLRTVSSKDGILYQRLGQWRVSHKHTRLRQPYIYNPATKQLYSHLQGEQYQAHECFRDNYFSPTPNGSPVEAEGYPTSVVSIMDFLCPLKDFTTQRPPDLQYISTTETFHPPWQATLLTGTRNLQSLATIRRHASRGNMISCSDGSANGEKNSFGFLVATQQGLRLVQGNGPAPGSFGNSFRSEAYGVLATLVWAQAICHHGVMDENPPGKWTHYLDNRSVIHRIKRARQTTHIAPNAELLPEHDVIKEIVTLISTLPWKFELEWVQGHQDAKVPYHNLSLAAQLNCQADRLATAYDHTTDTVPSLPSLPQSPCQLIIQGKNITRALKRRVVDAATIPAYHTYLCHRFGWQTSVLDNIDWENYKSLLRIHRTHWPTVVKHLHDISPTGHIAHRNNEALPHNCPACQVPYETNTHILLCTAASRANWRNTFLRNLNQCDNARADPYLMDILQDGVRHFFQSTQVQRDKYPTNYHDLIDTQNALGWGQLFKARWSKQWSLRQDEYGQQQSERTVTPGDRWVYNTSKKFLESWLELWQLRNEERHGQDRDQQEAFRKQIVTAELQELYQLKYEVCPSDRSVFHNTMEDHMLQHPNLSQLEDWICLYRDPIRASAKKAKLLGIHQTRTLLDYPMFNPVTQPGQRASQAGASPG